MTKEIGCRFRLESGLCPHFLSVFEALDLEIRGKLKIPFQEEIAAALAKIKSASSFMIGPKAHGLCCNPEAVKSREPMRLRLSRVIEGEEESCQGESAEDYRVEELGDGRVRRISFKGSRPLIIEKGREAIEIPDIGCDDASQRDFDRP